jgi:hypothetical protein
MAVFEFEELVAVFAAVSCAVCVDSDFESSKEERSPMVEMGRGTRYV